MNLPIDPLWFPPHYFATDLISRWQAQLLDASSTTVCFQSSMPDFAIEVLQHQIGMPLELEAQFLGMTEAEELLIREVNIYGANHLLMYARTLIPKDSLQDQEGALKNLSNQPLGSILYQDPTLQRTPFELAKILPQHFYYQQIQNSHPDLPAELWARRSLFYFHNKPLALWEVFMPFLLNYVDPST